MDEQNLNESKPSNCKTPLLKKALICSGCFVALIGLCVLAVYLVSENSHVIMAPWGRGLWTMNSMVHNPRPQGAIRWVMLTKCFKTDNQIQKQYLCLSFHRVANRILCYP